MRVDPRLISKREMYFTMISTIVPRPIAWVSTVSQNGVINLAPFSFFTGIVARPPTLCICVGNRPDGRPKDTAVNIEANGEFVVNVAPYRLAQAMVRTSGAYPYELDELAEAGLTPLPSEHVAPPRVAEAPVHMECKLKQIVEIEDDPDPDPDPGAEPSGVRAVTNRMIIGRIVLMHIDDAVIDERGRVDPRKLDAVGRMGGKGYARTTDLFEIARPEIPEPKA